ncbi:DUF2779 domain-containing protein [Candidatus Woesearchaeota archaeon]|nr:DUF2779 domain-containing protein [Candidatus Woesearchaeota archaeon]
MLTKSKYLIGLKCPKYLWVIVNAKHTIPEAEDSDKLRFAEGTAVGKLATTLFSGIDLSELDFKDNIAKTEKSLKLKKPVFEAGILVDDLFSRADILKPVEGGWDIIEVKSGTKVKPENIHDLSFQKFVYEKAGLKIRKCFLMHLNNEYVRKGRLDVKKLFTQTDITSEVEDVVDIEDRIELMKGIIAKKACPKLQIHDKCEHPYKCPLMSECHGFLPTDNVLKLYRLGKKSFKLIESGIYAIKDVPDEFKLNSNQEIQRKCARSNKIHVDKAGIKSFLKKLKYPLYYLDFESFNLAIPPYDGLKPYSQVCFQFSLHVQDKVDGPCKHYSFLASTGDPRKEFLVELKKVLGAKGSIVVFNQSFEINRLRELAELFPSYSSWVESAVNRVVDLIVPFRSFFYYNPIQEGKYSLKKVLPAVTGKSYEGMEISAGSDASLEYMWITHGLPWRKKATEKDIKRVRENLLEYCCLDTEGMVWIVDELWRIV